MGRSADLPRSSGQTDGDDSGCRILHVDMDAFFASVEIRRRPELRNRPVVVGGGTRGVVAAASYEARKYGVRSAMSMSMALRRCPHAVVLPPDRAAYSAASAAVMSIFRDVTELVEPLSLDEAFLDVAPALRRLGRPADIARLIRARVQESQQLTCSVGIASTKFVAKLASARCKPDGMLVVPADRTLEFLHPLPVTALWGVGPSTADALRRLGLRTVGELAETPLDVLRRSVGAAHAVHLSELARAHDPRAVVPDQAEKSVSADRTFDVDITDEPSAGRELLRLADEVGSRLRARSLVARTVGIKVRFPDFRTLTRARTLSVPTDSTAHLHEVAVELYRALDLDRPRVRLLGVKSDGLSARAATPHQLSLDDVETGPDQPVDDAERSGGNAEVSARAELAADAARLRFGPAAVRAGSLLTAPPADSRRIDRHPGANPPADTLSGTESDTRSGRRSGASHDGVRST